jgi:hypothetical protein
VMLYCVVISCVWGELPAFIFRVVRKDYPEDEGSISSKTMVTNYHVPDDLNLHIFVTNGNSTYVCTKRTLTLY